MLTTKSVGGVLPTLWFSGGAQRRPLYPVAMRGRIRARAVISLCHREAFLEASPSRAITGMMVTASPAQAMEMRS
jgi:hypothetical protein